MVTTTTKRHSTKPMAEMGLNEHHQSIVKSYLKYARFLRAQNLKAIDMCIQDVIDTRLLEDTYTLTEVKEILHNLYSIVHSEVETELISLAHTSVLVLSQLFLQAEKWHLKLAVDFSEIQNRELLEHVKELETSDLSIRTKLEPMLYDDGSRELLRIEIERLQMENKVLDGRIHQCENQIAQLKEERNQLLESVEIKDGSIAKLSCDLQQVTKSLEQQHLTDPSHQALDPEHLLNQYEQVLSEQLRSEMEDARQQMLSAQLQLSIAEKELERKFNQTSTYMNMKKMINKKNEQVKALRQRLLKFEPQGVEDSD